MRRPQGFGFDSVVEVHEDAGRLDQSYRRDGEWCCFCIGNFRAGCGEPEWWWVVLPPADPLTSA